jgi:hypothetical protein
MSSSAKISKDWVLSWTDLGKLEKDNGLPPGTFPDGCEMAVRPEDLVARTLSWQNVLSEPCAMTLFAEGGEWKRSNFNLHIGGVDFPCDSAQLKEVTSEVSKTRLLVGFLVLGTGQTGNAGTFVAQANPDPPDGEGALSPAGSP